MTKPGTGSPNGNGASPFAHFASEAAGDNEPVAVPLKNRQGEPYVGKSGQPITITVVGKYSTQYKAVERRLTDKVLKQSRRGVDFDAEDAEQRHAERLAGACTAWTVETEDGKPVPFSTANAVLFLRIAPWVAPQLEQAIEAHDRFFVRSSTS